MENIFFLVIKITAVSALSRLNKNEILYIMGPDSHTAVTIYSWVDFIYLFFCLQIYIILFMYVFFIPSKLKDTLMYCDRRWHFLKIKMLA